MTTKKTERGAQLWCAVLAADGELVKRPESPCHSVDAGRRSPHRLCLSVRRLRAICGTCPEESGLSVPLT